MSILDGMPTQDDFQRVAEQLAPKMAELLDSDKLSPKMKSIYEAMGEGISLGTILGLKKEHRDALLHQALNLMRAGENAKAREFLEICQLLDPVDQRPSYALGIILQQSGDFATAAKLFTMFLAMDATNPDGYLRLGECFFGAAEYDNAQDCFETAKSLTLKGHAKADRAELADKMLELVTMKRQNA
jgi:tetratricopeptide (TPR) repeat protein